MKFDSIKDLENFFKLCRKYGVEKISLNGLEVSLNPFNPSEKKPSKASQIDQLAGAFDPGKITYQAPKQVEVPWEDLSPEDKLFYSATNDPA